MKYILNGVAELNLPYSISEIAEKIRNNEATIFNDAVIVWKNIFSVVLRK